MASDNKLIQNSSFYNMGHCWLRKRQKYLYKYACERKRNRTDLHTELQYVTGKRGSRIPFKRFTYRNIMTILSKIK